MSFQALLKNKQNRLLSKTWRMTLAAREIERNNFHTTGDLRKAREFAQAASVYKEMPQIVEEPIIEPTVVYLR